MTEHDAQDTPTSRARNRRRTAAVAVWLILTIVAAIALRAHTFHEPIDCDEAVYLYSAHRMLAGDGLYRDLWADPKPPGVYGLYCLGVAIGGYGEATVAWLPVPFVAASILLVYSLTRQLGSGRFVACFGALLFALASCDPYVFGNGSNTEVYINTLYLAAMVLVFRTGRAVSWPAVLVGGCALGVASLFKQLAVVHVIVGAGMVWTMVRGMSRRQRLGRTALFVAGVATPWAVALIWAVCTGIVSDMVYTVLVYPFTLASDAGELTGSDRWGRITGALAGSWHLWLCAGLGMGSCLIRRWPAQRGYLVAWTASALVQVALPGFYWPHYFLLAYPMLILWVTLWLSDLVRLSRQQSDGDARRLMLGPTAVIAAAVLGGLVWTLWFDYLTMSADEVSTRYQGPQWVGCRDLGRTLGRLVARGETIYEWGIRAPLYVYSQRDSASRFFFTDPYTEKHPTSPGPFHQAMRRQIIEDLKRHRPAVVTTRIDMFPELVDLLAQGYSALSVPGGLVVGYVRMQPPGFTVPATQADPSP